MKWSFIGILAPAFCMMLASRTVLPRQNDEAAPKPPGKLVDIGGYKLHLHATGQRNPAVILIAGSGDFSFDWSLVQPEVSTFARVCSYDRAGFAWSDFGPVPRTMKQEAYELRLLLKKAGIQPPYILVGHSLGGLIARIYHREYASEVAGIVLVDSTHEDTTLMINGKLVQMRTLAQKRPIPPVQTLKSSPPQPPTEEDKKQAEFNLQMFGPPKTEPPFDKLPSDIQTTRLWMRNHPRLSASSDTYFTEELEELHEQRAKSPCPLGEKPLIVLVPDNSAPPSPPPDVSAEEWKRILNEKREQKIGMTQLSRNSQLTFARRSRHHIHLDEPGLVIQAIRQVVEAAQRKSKLPSP